jgi:hypothetical protein
MTPSPEAAFFSQKAVKAADAAWDKNGWSEADVQLLLNTKLRSKSTDPAEKKRIKAKVKLLKTMAEMGRKATEHGLTDEILEQLLKEE